MSGRGVLVGGGNGPYYFELPESFAQPTLFQDTFATGNGTGWTALAGSQFSVVQSGNTRVFRQASTAGDAGAVLNAYDWTNQSIQAEVKPTAVNGNDRWVGLATRRTDASNYYYVTLRSSGIIQLKRLQGGVIATIDSASVPWVLNRKYRLRLESVGTLQRVYVDGILVLEAWDDALSHGRAALLTYRAAADYDNVIVSPFLTQTIYSASDGMLYSPPLLQPEPWTYSGTGQWSWQSGGPGDLHFNQASTAGDARAVVGPEQVFNTDQIVQTRVRPLAFNAAGDPWVGVMARYTGTTSYVYMSLRRSNTVTLRKVVERHHHPARQRGTDGEAQRLVHAEARSRGHETACLCERSADSRSHGSSASDWPCRPRGKPRRGRLRQLPCRHSIGGRYVARQFDRMRADRVRDLRRPPDDHSPVAVAAAAGGLLLLRLRARHRWRLGHRHRGDTVSDARAPAGDSRRAAVSPR